MTRQIVLIFTVDQEDYPEVVLCPIEELADVIQDSVDVNFESVAEEIYLNEKELTHLIVRDLDNGDEKNVVARRLLPVTVEDIESMSTI